MVFYVNRPLCPEFAASPEFVARLFDVDGL
jgi:hypothetical protein